MCSILGALVPTLGKKMIKDDKKNKREIARINSMAANKENENKATPSPQVIQAEKERLIAGIPVVPTQTTGTGINNNDSQINHNQTKIGLNL